MTTTLSIDTIITDDPAFIVRDERLDEPTVTTYAEEPDHLPAIEVWRDPETEEVYLLDGQHRLAAHQRRSIPEIRVTYFDGTRVEAEARARVANLWHGLQLTQTERRRLRTEVIERLFEYSNKWIADDFLRCSSNTVAALRESLEETGRIPKLDRFKRKGGGTIPRTYENEDANEKAPDDGLFGTERNIQPPADLMAPEEEPNNNDGGYNVEEGGEEYGDEGSEMPSNRATRNNPDYSPADGDNHRAKPHQTTVKLAQIGESLAIEVIAYIDGQPHSVPVTLLIADGPIAGVEDTAPDHHNVLVIDSNIAQQMGLLM